MFSEIKGKGIPCPVSLGLDDIERDASQKVLQGPSNPQAVAFQVGQVEKLGQFFDFEREFSFAQRAVFSRSVGPRKNVLVGGNCIDVEMVLEGSNGVTGAFLACTLDSFAAVSRAGGFCPW